MYATFQGAKEVVVAAGAKAVSDPVTLPVASGARLKVDLYLPERTQLAGFHWDARDETLLLPGNAAGRPAPAGAEKLATRAFLSAVLVESAREPVTVVALGDSITDGNGSTPGADHRWPDFLARRLAPHGRRGAERGHLGQPPAASREWATARSRGSTATCCGMRACAR